MDGAGDSWVILDAARNHGSGSGDMYAYIPVKAFKGALSTDFVYMYTQFGTTAGGSTEGGFEEWSIDTTPEEAAHSGGLGPRTSTRKFPGGVDFGRPRSTYG